MGCFSTRCLLTNRQLTTRDEIVGIPLIREPSFLGEQHVLRPTDIWHVCGLPMVGMYDDYGSIEVDDSYAVKFNSDFLNISIENMSRSFHHTKILYSTCNEIRIVENDYKVSVKDKKSFFAPSEHLCGLAIVSLKAWKYAIKHFYRGKVSSVDVCNKFIKELSSKDGKANRYIACMSYYDIIDAWPDTEQWVIRKIFGDVGDERPVDRLLCDKIKKSIIDTLTFDENCLNLIDEIECVNGFMHIIGKMWMPGYTIGNQHPDTDDMKREIEWLDFCKKEQTRVYTQRKYDMGE